jgi:hypothetical protein
MTKEELEKENAELKAIRQDCVKLTEDNVVMARQIAETAKQLTKAKELIRTLLLIADNKVSQMEFLLCVAEAKRFISEVEK